MFLFLISHFLRISFSPFTKLFQGHPPFFLFNWQPLAPTPSSVISFKFRNCSKIFSHFPRNLDTITTPPWAYLNPWALLPSNPILKSTGTEWWWHPWRQRGCCLRSCNWKIRGFLLSLGNRYPLRPHLLSFNPRLLFLWTTYLLYL